MTAQIFIAPLILLSALAMVWCANSVHAALMLALTLALQAVLYLVLGAHFTGLIQLMVYVGGVSILIVFAILMTRPGDDAVETIHRPGALSSGLPATIPVGASLLAAFASSPALMERTENASMLSLAEIGHALFTSHVVAVLLIAVLLTAVLAGAALLAQEDDRTKTD